MQASGFSLLPSPDQTDVSISVEDLSLPNNRVCMLIRGALSPKECKEIISQAESQGFNPSNATYPSSYRNNYRLVVDDEELSTVLYKRVKHLIPNVIQWQRQKSNLSKRNISASDLDGTELASWNLCGLNERFRFCKYFDGQSFMPHQDGEYWRDHKVQSKLTMMIYLNSHDEFRGGETNFLTERYGPDCSVLKAVEPECGMMIVFEHDLWHEGAAVFDGTKYIMRTDVMYEKESNALDATSMQSSQALETYAGHSGYIWSVIELQDGSLASASRDKTVKVWNRQTKECVQTFHGHTNSVLCLLQLEDGTIVTGSRDFTIKLWNLNGECLQTVHHHTGNVLALWNLGQGIFASGGGDNIINIWKWNNQKVTHWRTLEGHQNWIWSLAQQGNLLISGSEDGTIIFWDWQTGQHVKRLVYSHPIHCVAVMSDQYMLSGSSDCSVQVWDMNANQLAVKLQGHSNFVRAVLPLGSDSFASGSEDDTIKVWKQQDGGWVCIKTSEHLNYVKCLAKLKDNTIASGSYDCTVRVWQLQQ